MQTSKPATKPTGESNSQTLPQVTALDQTIAENLGFIFDPAHFPFTLLELLTQIAAKLRELGLEKTGGKVKDREQQYSYFEEAEISKHLVALLVSNHIGHAAGTARILGRFANGRTKWGNIIWAHHVQSGAVFSHKQSGEWIIIPGVGEAADAGDKGVTKAITSAIKYIWMKTFLISEGNDIETIQEEYGQPPEPKAKAKTAPQAKKSTVQNRCTDCKGEVKGIKSPKDGKPVAAEVIAAKALEKFGVILCADCAGKRSTKKGGKPAPSKAPAEGRELLDTTLIEASSRSITTKGKKKTIFDLKLDGGVKVTDWHESHYDLYRESEGGEHIKLVVEVKQNGKYTNRDVFALMEFGELSVEDEQGNKEETMDQRPTVDDAFGGQAVFDEDIPF